MFREREPRVRDPVYMGWIAKLPCAACMVRGTVTWGVHVAHLRAGNLEHDKRETGKGEKPSDRWTLPLCPPHHTGDVRRVEFSQHEMGELDFWRRLGIDPFELCGHLYDAYKAGRPGAQVISRYAAHARRKLEGAAPMDEEKIRAHYVEQQAAGALPTVALSIKQPWAWLIVHGWKDVENRGWRRVYPPRALVHAGKEMDETANRALLAGEHPSGGEFLPTGLAEAYARAKKGGEVLQGGFVGVTNIIGCHDGMRSDFESDWFVGAYGYQLSQARALPFLPWRGMLGFFSAKVAS